MWCLARLRCRNTLKFHGPSRKCIIRKVIGKLVCCSVGENVNNEEKLFKVGEGFSISSRAFLQSVLLAVDCWLVYGLHDWSTQRNKLRLSWTAASAQESRTAVEVSKNRKIVSCGPEQDESDGPISRHTCNQCMSAQSYLPGLTLNFKPQQPRPKSERQINARQQRLTLSGILLVETNRFSPNKFC